MSLSKQLLILLSILFFIIFTVNFTLSVENIRAYLEGESQSHAQDTATSLGLSLSPYMTDTGDPIIKTMVSAIFDMGDYQEIRLLDADNKELLALSNDKAVAGVPGWFIDYLPMSTMTAHSEISSGWAVRGVLYVTINPSFAYAKLYEQAKNSLAYSLITFAVALTLLALLLRLTLASLTKIDRLALQITEGHFAQIESLPWTSEVKNVTVSLNIMSRKIASTIAALNNQLDELGASLLRDDLTGLYKKSVFETDMMELLMAYSPAYLMLIKLDSLPELARERGNDAIDRLLLKFAEKIQSSVERHLEPHIKAYRFYGGEFAILVNSGNIEQIKAIAQALSDDFAELGEHYAQADLAHIGVTPVNPVATTESLLETAHETYEQARLIGVNSYYIGSDENFSRDISAWKELVFSCIDHGDYSLSYVDQVAHLQSGRLIMEEAITQVHDQNGHSVAIGPFISIAEKFAKIVDLDKGIIGKALDHILSAGIQHAIAVNLSTRTIKNAEFRLWLENLIKNNLTASRHLVFSFSAYAVAKDVDAYADFIDAVHLWGGQVMIKRFEPQSMSPEITKKLKPDFIRLAREIGDGISLSRQKHEFVQAMQQIGILLDIAVLAENVRADEDYSTVKALGIAGASR